MAIKPVSAEDLGCVTWLLFRALQLFSVNLWMAAVNAGDAEEDVALHSLLLSFQWHVILCKSQDIAKQVSLWIKVGLVTHCRGWWEAQDKVKDASTISSAYVSRSLSFLFSIPLIYHIHLVSEIVQWLLATRSYWEHELWETECEIPSSLLTNHYFQGIAPLG